MKSTGLHHITAICSDPKRNKTFYTEVLGLRFVKKTVNHDDPGTYHLYYGDDDASPGTLLTFFAYPGIKNRVPGTGEANEVRFSIPLNSTEYWTSTLENRGIQVEQNKLFGNNAVVFQDPDGLKLRLVEIENDDRNPANTYVPEEHGIRGFHSVQLHVSHKGYTEKVLKQLGYNSVETTDSRTRYIATESTWPSFVDIIESPDQTLTRQGLGSIHHVAYRATTDEAHLDLREQLDALGMNVTEVIDRKYFHSIYFREPSGILFEVATDRPGFTVDEDRESLGEKLVLPRRLEPFREEIQKELPRL